MQGGFSKQNLFNEKTNLDDKIYEPKLNCADIFWLWKENSASKLNWAFKDFLETTTLLNPQFLKQCFVNILFYSICVKTRVQINSNWNAWPDIFDSYPLSQCKIVIYFSDWILKALDYIKVQKVYFRSKLKPNQEVDFRSDINTIYYVHTCT